VKHDSTSPVTLPEPLKLDRGQWVIVFLIAAVQFVNILDFVIIMPLGPELARALSAPESQHGYVSSAYTGAACVSGLVGSLFLDRFDRRKALAVAMLGLVVGTGLGGFAVDRNTFLLSRVIAGVFGGPATAIALSIISDTIPARLRGVAMGTVMGAFSLASVLGVPAGLVLAEQFSWRVPLFAVSGVGLAVCAFAIFALPPMTGHLGRSTERVDVWGMLRQPLVQLSYVMTAVVMTAGFVVIPNIAAFLQLNMGYPAAGLKYTYSAGGLASLFATQFGGRAVDRFGSFWVGTVGAFGVIALVYGFFYLPHGPMPQWVVMAFFVAFMMANGLRNVSYNTLATKVPPPELRARFQSLQSAIQHGATFLAGILSAQLLSTIEISPGVRQLAGMDRVALVSMALSFVIPVMLFVVEARVKRAATTER
jgi:predicted MFS family arabinose efflux permease